MVGWIWKRAAISDVVWSPLRAARATLDLNDGLYCLRFLLMILLLVEMMNQSLGTCPNFGVHFIRPTANAGIITLPPRLKRVFSTIAIMSSSIESMSLWMRLP